MFNRLLATILFLSISIFAFAQKPDTLAKNKKDTTVLKLDPSRSSFAPKIKKEKIYHPDSTHIPSLAVKRSLIIPGWGQVYNRKYWKLPIIYGGLGLLATAVIFNQTNYNEFTALAKIVRTGKVPLPGETLYPSYIKYKADYDLYAGQSYDFFANASNSYQRNRDLSILGILGLWGLQTIDAYIDAKFINSFTVDSNLSFKVTPGLLNQPVYAFTTTSNAYIPGIKITFTLK